MHRTSLLLKLGLLAALAVAAWLMHRRRREGAMKAPLWLKGTAAVIVAVGLVAWADAGTFVRGHFMNYHDLYHYHFGSKYSEEVGYTHLYFCTLVAMDEIDPRWHRRARSIRSMSSYRYVAKKWVLKRSKQCRERFSDARWKEFKDDLRSYRKGYRRNIAGRLGDKGYNAPPTWDLIGGFFTRRVSLADKDRVIWLLGGLDVILMLGALGLAWWAFGPFAALACFLWLAAGYEWSKPHIRGGFLRVDWLACLIASLAALRKQRPALAGGLLAYSAMIRVFPVLFLLGPGIDVLRTLLRERRVLPRQLRFFAAFTLGCALFFGATVVKQGDLSQWKQWVQKIKLHDGDVAGQRVGLKYALMYRGETRHDQLVGVGGKGGYRPGFVDRKTAVYKRSLWFVALLLLGFAGGLIYVFWERDDLPTLAMLAFPLVYTLIAPTFYYSIYLAAVALVLAADVARRSSAIILGGMAIYGAVVQLIMWNYRFKWQAHCLYSIAFGAFCIFAVATLVRERRGEQRAATA